MTSLRERRQSFNGGFSSSPRIVIPPNNVKDSIQLDSTSPTLSANSGSLSPEFPPTLVSAPSPPPNISLHGSGALSPELQPITPPVLSKPSQGVLQIGKYLLVEELDCNVHKAVNIHSGEEKICKVFTQETYRSKIAAYCRLYGSTSVIEISEIIQGDKYVYVFFNKNYGDLHSYVRSRKKLKEEEAIGLYRQIADAVEQCHRCGVVIRDLKLRKFVFTNPEKTKIQLEGLEESYLLDDEDDTLCDKQGCPAYVSPEILENAHIGYSGKASDQWSSGVMLFTMLIGRYPFQESEPITLFKKIRLGKYSIPSHLSGKAKCLIRNLLRREASDRLTAEETLLHPWLKQNPSSLGIFPVTSFKENFDDRLVPTWKSVDTSSH